MTAPDPAGDLARAARIALAWADLVDALPGWVDARHADLRSLAEELADGDVTDAPLAAALLAAARAETVLEPRVWLPGDTVFEERGELLTAPETQALYVELDAARAEVERLRTNYNHVVDVAEFAGRHGEAIHKALDMSTEAETEAVVARILTMRAEIEQLRSHGQAVANAKTSQQLDGAIDKLRVVLETVAAEIVEADSPYDMSLPEALEVARHASECEEDDILAALSILAQAYRDTRVIADDSERRARCRSGQMCT